MVRSDHHQLSDFSGVAAASPIYKKAVACLESESYESDAIFFVFTTNTEQEAAAADSEVATKHVYVK